MLQEHLIGRPWNGRNPLLEHLPSSNRSRQNNLWIRLGGDGRMEVLIFTLLVGIAKNRSGNRLCSSQIPGTKKIKFLQSPDNNNPMGIGGCFLSPRSADATLPHHIALVAKVLLLFDNLLRVRQKLFVAEGSPLVLSLSFLRPIILIIGVPLPSLTSRVGLGCVGEFSLATCDHHFSPPRDRRCSAIWSGIDLLGGSSSSLRSILSRFRSFFARQGDPTQFFFRISIWRPRGPALLGRRPPLTGKR